MKKDKGCLVFLIITITIICLLILGYGLFPDKEIYLKFFEYLNNQTIAQTVAVLVGFLGLFLGYFIWENKHNKELVDKYFSEYINSVFNYFAIKQKEVDIRKAKNRRFWDIIIEIGNDEKRNLEKVQELFKDQRYLWIDSYLEEIDKQRIECMGTIKAKKFLLNVYKDRRHHKIENILIKFDEKYKKYSKERVVDEYHFQKDKNITKEEEVYKEVTNCINSYLEEKRKEIEDIVKEL